MNRLREKQKRKAGGSAPGRPDSPPSGRSIFQSESRAPPSRRGPCTEGEGEQRERKKKKKGACAALPLLSAIPQNPYRSTPPLHPENTGKGPEGVLRLGSRPSPTRFPRRRRRHRPRLSQPHHLGFLLSQPPPPPMARARTNQARRCTPSQQRRRWLKRRRRPGGGVKGRGLLQSCGSGRAVPTL